MDTNDIRKKFLCSMPIWDEAEDFQVRLELLRWKADQIEQITLDLEKKLKTQDEPKSKSSDESEAPQTAKSESSDENGRPQTAKSESSDKNEPPQTAKPELTSSIEMLQSSPRKGEEVFAMDNCGKPWFHCEIKSIYRQTINSQFSTIFKLKRLSDGQIIKANKFSVARIQNHGNQLHVSKRVIAGLDNDNLLPGIIGQECCEDNRNRYLVFMDDGTANYYTPQQVYPIVYQSKKPWSDFRQIGIRNEELNIELEHFFRLYPRRNVIQVRIGQQIDVRKNKEWTKVVVIGKECDVLRLIYRDRKEEFLYRGSMRFVKRSAMVGRLTQNCYAVMNPRLAESISDYHKAGRMSIQEDDIVSILLSSHRVPIGGNTARKSTATRLAPPRIKVSSHPGEESRRTEIVQKLSQSHYRDHKCSPDCLGKTEDSVDIIKDFREVSDLKVPLKLGWERILVEISVPRKKGRGKTKRIVYAYKAPCGRTFTQPHAIRNYLNQTNSKLDIDYFTMERNVDLTNTLEDRLAYYYEPNMAINTKTGQSLENKYVSVINVVNEEHLASDFIYNNERFPHKLLAAKGFSFNEDFKSGCDCEDDCNNPKVNCPCQRLIEELAGKTDRFRGKLDDKIQYKEKRLYDQVSTGIFECNSFCNCSSKCPNRVVQNGIRLRLQVRKTINKGWGVFVLDDVPMGTFICTYAAEILDDADQYGDSDMYFADLDYMTVLEAQKMALADSNENLDEGIEVVGRKRRHVLESDSDSDLEQVNDDFFPRMPDNSGFMKIHTLLNETQDYTLDARLQGNVGRFFNHSCDPNSFVQNVFIESHDPRFPHVAFFTKKNLQADDEITWNYNYKIDSIKGRQIDCNCGASNCKGRIL